MANTRYKGANASERLTLSTLSDSDMFQTRHLPGTVSDADKGVSKALLQALPIAVCATAAATAAKVGTLAPESCPDFSLINGRTVHVYFSAANTASVPTLNLAGTGAIPITYPDGSYVGEWPAGCCLDLMYISIVDGNTAIERWVLVSSLPVDEVTLNNMQSVTSNAVAKLKKLVWTNPNPNAAMGAQTITFDESAQGYDFLEIEFTQYTNWRRHICKIPIGAQSQVQCMSVQQGDYYGNTRVIETSTSTTIEIGGGILNALNGTLVSDNNACLIERIWAVR